MDFPPLVFEHFLEETVSPERMDALWAAGWRHFGPEFFRTSLTEHGGRWDIVLPLRVDLARFVPRKSQRRVLRRNADLDVAVGPARITGADREMFARHKRRFRDNVPERLEDFLGDRPGEVPGPCLEFRCLRAGETVAVSYLDVGREAVSSVYGMFEPAEAGRGLGTFTLLRELAWARASGKRYAYPGYATVGASHYDYKKRLGALETLDWATLAWRRFEPGEEAEGGS
jgi:arginine-tRNA-protein transferase